MKKFISTLFLALFAAASWAYDAKINGIYYWLSSGEKTAEVTSGDVNYTGNVVIPESVTYNGVTYSVTSIDSYAFYSCTGLTSVTIPNSVTSIRSGAFYSCTGLKSVTIGNSVASIGMSAFCACESLTSVEIPSSVTSIEDRAFFSCTGLTSVTIPNSVTSIGKGVYSACMGLTSIKVESGNPAYDSRNDCNAIVEKETNTLIAGCKKTIIPSSVTSIGELAFHGCKGMTSITIPDAVTGIGDYAFDLCTDLTSVAIGCSVASIGYKTFYDCYSLLDIYVGAATPPTCDSQVFGTAYQGDVVYDTATLHVVEGTKDLYSSAGVWNEFKNITDDLISGIEEVSGSEVPGTRKYIQNGRIIIENGDKQFTIDGAEIK